MELLETIISCCGAALVTGIFSVILANKGIRKERQAADNAVMAKLDALREQLAEHIREDATAKADAARNRILRFGDEVRREVLHTEEHWIEILRDIDQYENFCEGHPDYENNRATRTIQYLKNVYDGRLKKNDFLK